MTDLHAEHELDTCGLRCPEPVMMLHRQIRKMQVGEVVWIRATDPATERDIPQFCEFLPHELVASQASEDRSEFHYWVRKGQR